ncbi:MAG: hypothetical protein COB04_15735 [Gammaproteobacteria bacterium]|nr:MAG: hypothetical protein COB04_15735 [Gammaproteobacteria bacterium]
MSCAEFELLQAGMKGLPVSYSWRGYETAIFVEVGQLTQDPTRNHPAGEYSVMLDCEWRLEGASTILCGSSSEQDMIDEQLSLLLKEHVVAVELIGSLPEVVITFTSGYRLVSFRTDIGHPEWTIFLSDDAWLCSIDGQVVQQKTPAHQLARP